MRFDIKTKSEANQREHWAVKNKRKKAQQKAFAVLWRQFKPKFKLPVKITFTRFSCKTLDSDNLTSAFKGLRDQLAGEIGIDDGSELIDWQYRQQKISTRNNYFELEIESL